MSISLIFNVDLMIDRIPIRLKSYNLIDKNNGWNSLDRRD